MCIVQVIIISLSEKKKTKKVMYSRLYSVQFVVYP